jgi:integrase
MDNMGLEEEWINGLVGKRTQDNYKREFKVFKEYMKKTPEEILQLRKEEGKRFITRLVMFFDYLQKKGLSQNTARTMIIPIQSFLSYFDMPLKVSDKLPNLHMKLEDRKITLEELQLLYKLGDLETKAWLSLSRDCPARIGDLLKITSEQIQQTEFLIKSEKENVVGKVYISENTKELWSKDPKIPRTQQGIDKLLKKACSIAKIPEINQHALRKMWITTAINLGIQDTIVRILTFKAVPEATLTYFLDRTELRDSWQKVIDVLQLERKENGRITHLQDAVSIFSEVLARTVLQNLKAKDLQRLREMGFDVQKLLGEEPIEQLKVVLGYLKKKETDYEVNARHGKEDSYKGKDSQ